MSVIGVIFWLGWHRIQFVRESEHLEKARKMGDREKIAKHQDTY